MQKTYMLLGAGPGIGLSTARRFAAEGFRIVLAARNAHALNAMAEDLRSEQRAHVEVVSIDLTNLHALETLMQRHLGTLEVLHYNAAGLTQHVFAQQSNESVAQDVSIGLTAALISMRMAASEMAKRQQGTILLTGGGLALNPTIDYLTLGACKAALRNAVRAMAKSPLGKELNTSILTINQAIRSGTPDADNVADAFWRMYEAPRDQWVWEQTLDLSMAV